MLPILLLQDVISVWAYRHHWDAWNLKVLIPGGLIGVAAAGLLAAYVPDAAVRLAVGVIGVTFVLWRWFGPVSGDIGIRPSAFSGVFWGALSGFTSTLANAGAPPWQVHMMPQHLPKLVFAGTATMYFAATNAGEGHPLFRARAIHHRHASDLGGAVSACDRHQFSRHLAGACDAAGNLLQDRLCDHLR